MCVVPAAHQDLALESVDAYQAFRDELAAAGLLVPMGVPGLYGRGALFERIVVRFDDYVSRTGSELRPEILRFPPLFSRADYERIDHIRNFPDLMGSVHTFIRGEGEHRDMLGRFERKEDWSRDLDAAEVMLTPAICYPLYPTLTGALPPGGRRFDLLGFAFRHEPSDDPARMQVFRQHEFVRVGAPDEALEHRDYWLERGREMFASVGLPVKIEIANDPFFGRGGRVQKALQREQDLKYEFLIPICSTGTPTAIASSNCHLDHFGAAFGITTHDGKTAHSACVGFGLERIALALLKTHGFTIAAWPREVRDVLALD
jgi:seryl-tRNA synthetase